MAGFYVLLLHYGNDGHMRVTALINFMSENVRYYVGMFTNLVMLVALNSTSFLST